MPAKWLLVTDVDDTLLGDETAVDRFLAATATAPLVVVLNSSRPVASVRSGLRDRETPVPYLGIIGALGTEIELEGEPLDSWSAQFSGFDRRRVDAVMARHGADPHPPELQTRFKASYALPEPSWPAAQTAVEALDFPVRTITSGSTNFDVIPASAGKAAAVRYVAGRLAIPAERVVTAGDSANDVDLLATGHGIAVGNATDRLRRSIPDTVYQAVADRADGIVEGLRHHGVPLGNREAVR